MDMRINEKDVKYKLYHLGDDDYCETKRHKIEEFIRSKIGKELVTIYADRSISMDFMAVLYDDDIIDRLDIYFLIKDLWKFRTVRFFISKTESLAKYLHVEKQDYDNWVGITLGEMIKQGDEENVELMVNTAHLKAVNSEIINIVVNDIMAFTPIMNRECFI